MQTTPASSPFRLQPGRIAAIEIAGLKSTADIMAEIRHRNLIAVEKIMRSEIAAREGQLPPLSEISQHGQKVVNTWDPEFEASTVTYLWRGKRVCVCYTARDTQRDSISFRIVAYGEDGKPLTEAPEFQTAGGHGNSKPSSQTHSDSAQYPHV